MEEILRRELRAEEEVLQQFLRYGRLLQEANAVTNLTAIRDEKEAARLHFLDSVSLLPMADFAGKAVVDVGTGAGFPGLPLKLLQPELRLTLMDSNNKKIDFLKHVCAELEVQADCIWGRVEEWPEGRERFDIAVSRAVADLSVLAELCLPLVRPGGVFLAMKGPDCEEELVRSEFAVKALGGRVRDVLRYTVPDTDIVHAVVRIDKVKNTPPQYPRRYAQMKKKPLSGGKTI